MSDVLSPDTWTTWTASDLVDLFGAIPLQRVRHDPAPGTATEEDVITIHDREGRLYELVEETLLEKTVGTFESFLGMTIGTILRSFAASHQLGIVLGADGMLRLAPGLIRIPDVSFISWNRLPDRRIPDQAVADLVPDLAVEVISRGNTKQEMDRKLTEYFAAGVRLVWYVYPKSRELYVYTAADKVAVVSENESLEGGQVLPGFSVPVAELFAVPGQTHEIT